MTQVLINNRICDVDTSDLRTIGELSSRIKAAHLRTDDTLLSIQCSDLTITPQKNSHCLQNSLVGLGPLNFEIKRAGDAERHIAALSRCVDHLRLSFKEMPTGHAELEWSLLSRLEKIEDFICLGQEVYNQISNETIRSGELNSKIRSSHIHLLKLIKAMAAAYQRNDTQALHDLIEHELVDNLVQWKIRIIPLFKQISYL